MANLIDSPVPVTTPLSIGVSPNEVYKLDGSDEVEGAQVGASDSGVGISNRAIQQLVNRTAKINNALQAFAVAFSCLTADAGDAQNAGSGLFAIPMIWSTSPTNTPLLVQVGRTQHTVNTSTNHPSVGFNWPVAFPNSLITCFAWQIQPVSELPMTLVSPSDGGCTRTAALFRLRYITSEAPPVPALPASYALKFNWLAVGR